MVDRGEGVKRALDGTFASQEVGCLVTIDRQTRSRNRGRAERRAVEFLVERMEHPRGAAQRRNRSRQEMGNVRRLQPTAPRPNRHERKTWLSARSMTAVREASRAAASASAR